MARADITSNTRGGFALPELPTVVHPPRTAVGMFIF